MSGVQPTPVWSGWKTMGASTVNTMPMVLGLVATYMLGAGRWYLFVVLSVAAVAFEWVAGNTWMLAYHSMVKDTVREENHR